MQRSTSFQPQDLDPLTSFDHSVAEFDVLQTHISWIVLTGPFAYKIKKPVQFDFLDFSTLEQRERFCRRELEINRRFAPQLYHEVVAITRHPTGIRFGGDGELIDYAVKMTQFPQAALLHQQLAAGRISVEQMDVLADQIAAYHRQVPRMCFDDIDAACESLVAPQLENFRYFADHLEPPQSQPLQFLKSWTLEQLQQLQPVLAQRVQGGFIRECHGDLHLGNLLYWHDQFLAFDAIEFNDSFRQIDTINELAFLVMDLDDRDYTAWSRALLNRYLEISGDYEGLQLLRLYMVYRALVRAKVDLIQQVQQQQSGLSDEGWSYVEHALRYARPSPPTVTITHGVSGSGKSTGARQWVCDHGGIQFRSDVIRQQLPAPSDAVNAGDLNLGRYTSEMTKRTYQHLAELCRMTIEAGYSVVVDAACLQRWQRDLFRQLAQELNVSFQILSFTAPVSELRTRISQRQGDASEATLEVLDHQLQSRDPLDDDEQAWVISAPT